MTHQVAQTILSQLGGNKFLAMTGAKHLTGSENALSFHIGRNSKSVAGVRIQLDADDTYSLKFFGRGFMTIKAELSGVYADMLQEIFTRQTGLYTHL
jgi:hypothetical protein